MKQISVGIVMLVAGLINPVFGEELITDNFESYLPGTQPTARWKVNAPGAVTITTVDTEQSPFGDSGDTLAVVYSDTATDDPFSGAFEQSFADSAKLQVAFDFKSNRAGSGVPSFILKDSDGLNALQIAFSRSANRLIGYYNGAGEYVVLEPLSENTWYHVQVSADVKKKEFDLTLQRYGSEENVYKDLEFRNKVEALSDVLFINNAGGATKTTFVVDNVSIGY